LLALVPGFYFCWVLVPYRTHEVVHQGHEEVLRRLSMEVELLRGPLNWRVVEAQAAIPTQVPTPRTVINNTAFKSFRSSTIYTFVKSRFLHRICMILLLCIIHYVLLNYDCKTGAQAQAGSNASNPRIDNPAQSQATIIIRQC